MKTATIMIIIISLLSRTSAVKLQLSLLPSVDALEGGSTTLPCSFSPLTTDLNALFIQWWIVSDKIEDHGSIYDSHFKNTRPKVAEFAGDEVNGGCSLRILNVSRTDNLEFRCLVLCYRCNAENTKVEGRVKLNVKAAAPRSHGDAGGTTGAPGVETTPTPGLSYRETWLLLIGVGVGVIVIVGVMATIIIKKHGRQPGIFDLNSGNGRAEVQGDVNGVLLMNGGPLMTKTNRDKRNTKKTAQTSFEEVVGRLAP